MRGARSIRACAGVSLGCASWQDILWRVWWQRMLEIKWLRKASHPLPTHPLHAFAPHAGAVVFPENYPPGDVRGAGLSRVGVSRVCITVYHRFTILHRDSNGNTIGQSAQRTRQSIHARQPLSQTLTYTTLCFASEYNCQSFFLEENLLVDRRHHYHHHHRPDHRH